MLKRISALILAIFLLGSVQACQMPANIFKDDAFYKEKEAANKASSNIYDYDFSLDKLSFSLPVNYAAMSARGWKIAEVPEDEQDEQNVANPTQTQEETVQITPDSMLEGGAYSDYVPLANKGRVIQAKFHNSSKKEKQIADCKVVGIRLDAGDGELPKFKLKKDDLSVGSKYDVVLNACGKPSYISNYLPETGELVSIDDVKYLETDEDTVSTLHYKLTDHSFLSFALGTYEGESNCIVTVTMENDLEKEKPYDYSKEQKYVPDSIYLYRGPHLLGKQFSDFAIKYEGNLYTLPIPVRTLMDDGWEFVRGYGERVPMGTTMDGLIMRKGNLAVSMMVHNYDTKYAHTAINCYVVSLEACITGPHVSIMMSKGVTLGSTEKQLNDAFGKDYVKKHQILDEEGNYLPAQNDTYAIPGLEDGFIEKTVEEDYTLYSYIMPDEVPSVKLPVSITDIGDTGEDLLGDVRKHIDVYVDNATHMVYKIYLQNCPAYKVDEQQIIEQQMEEARRKEQEMWEKKQQEAQDGHKNEDVDDNNDDDETGSDGE